MSKLEFINRKFQEWVIATKLESQYTKEEIITMYLNKFDFLNLAVGIESASRIYFDTIPYGLTKTQAAMLVGMAQNPSMYNPIRFPDKALARRNTVLGQMLKYGKITKEEHDSLVNEPLGIKFRRADHNLGSATYFREFLRLWLSAKEPIRENYVDEREFIYQMATTPYWKSFNYVDFDFFNRTVKYLQEILTTKEAREILMKDLRKMKRKTNNPYIDVVIAMDKTIE